MKQKKNIQEKIIEILKEKNELASTEIHRILKRTYYEVLRALEKMQEEKLIVCTKRNNGKWSYWKLNGQKI